MKYTYQMKFKKIMSMDPFQPEEDVLCFAGFLSETGEMPKVTNSEIIERNKDYVDACKNYLQTFFGNKQENESTYVCRWCDDLEANAYIYFIVDNESVREFIISSLDELRFNNDLNNLMYFANIDNVLTSVIVEQGDVIYDNYEEAQNSINKEK